MRWLPAPPELCRQWDLYGKGLMGSEPLVGLITDSLQLAVDPEQGQAPLPTRHMLGLSSSHLHLLLLAAVPGPTSTRLFQHRARGTETPTHPAHAIFEFISGFAPLNITQAAFTGASGMLLPLRTAQTNWFLYKHGLFHQVNTRKPKHNLLLLSFFLLVGFACSLELRMATGSSQG